MNALFIAFKETAYFLGASFLVGSFFYFLAKISYDFGARKERWRIEEEKKRAKIVCPYCDELVNARSVLCPECTKELVNNCPNCGKIVYIWKKVCPHCGDKTDFKVKASQAE